VHFVRGGKLAPLLDSASSAVTVNSTSAQQALWRGLPLKCFGAAVYDKPEFVSEQPLAEFFRSPKPPDSAAYRFSDTTCCGHRSFPAVSIPRADGADPARAVDRMLSETDGRTQRSEARNRHQSNTLQSVR
jgi:capsular polysaccharide export protein